MPINTFDRDVVSDLKCISKVYFSKVYTCIETGSMISNGYAIFKGDRNYFENNIITNLNITNFMITFLVGYLANLVKNETNFL